MDVEDFGSGDFTCELCGYDPIRYVHTMVHPNWQGAFRVGCVCDGTMSGDMLTAKQKDKAARLKSVRKSIFLKKQWVEHPAGHMLLNTRRRITAEKSSFRGREFYEVTVGDERYQWWNNRRVETLTDAKLLAFEVLEYERETDRTKTGH
jgi:hypothetical protein